MMMMHKINKTGLDEINRLRLNNTHNNNNNNIIIIIICIIINNNNDYDYNNA